MSVQKKGRVPAGQCRPQCDHNGQRGVPWWASLALGCNVCDKADVNQLRWLLNQSPTLFEGFNVSYSRVIEFASDVKMKAVIPIDFLEYDSDIYNGYRSK